MQLPLPLSIPSIAATANARDTARTAFRTAADALQAHHDSHAQQALDRARALELMFFEKPTHYFHARCDPRHFSDTTFTSLLDPADGQYVGLDTSEGLSHAHRIVADLYTLTLITYWWWANLA